MKEAELIAHISSICIRAAKGDLEARISPLPDSQGWNELSRAINALLDMSDSYVRESQAVLEYCSRHEYYRPVLVRGMRGAYRVASAVSVAAACEELTATSAEISRRLNDS